MQDFVLSIMRDQDKLVSMIRKWMLILLNIILLYVLTAAAQDDTEPDLLEDTPEVGRLYQPVSFEVNIDPISYINPFDPNDISLLGHFRSPSGRDVSVIGFWMQPFEERCQQPCFVDDLQAVGDPTWLIRFTPDETGPWKYTIQLVDDGFVSSEVSGSLEVVESTVPGFIRPGDNRYFQYDNGSSYFPIGHNLLYSWDEAGGLVVYKQWLRDLAASGGNYARLLIDLPWFISLEWRPPVGNYTAAQEAAARLDDILQTAADEGIALQLVLVWHQGLKNYSPPPVNLPPVPRPDMSADWSDHPYNVTLGGSLSGPGIFYTDLRAQEWLQRRLRYIVARWGYSPQIFAWELIDKIDQKLNYEPGPASGWVSTMAGYLRGIDPYQHMITVGSSIYDPLILSNPSLDFTQGEFYQRRPIETAADQVIGIQQIIRRQLKVSPAPALVNAFSLNSWFEPTEDDPQGIHVQMSLWAAALSGSGGGAASDWWYSYLIPQNIQRYYRSISAFTEDVDWGGLRLEPAPSALIVPDERDYQPITITDFERQFLVRLSNTPPVIDLTADGALPGLEEVSAYLYGRVFNGQLNQPQTYRLAVPVDTYFDVKIQSVSNDIGARLAIALDSTPISEVALAAGSRNTVVRVPLSAGEHTIMLDNTGDDWLQLDYVEVGALRVEARSLTLRDAAAGVALAWIHHRDFSWETVQANEAPRPIQLAYRLDKMPPGLYRVEIWDPLLETIPGEVSVLVGQDGVLLVDLPPLQNQLALRIFRQERMGQIELPPPSSTPVITATPTATATVTPSLAPTVTAAPTLTPLLLITNTPRPTESAVPGG